MNTRYAEILEDKGFQDVAAAVRQATVSAQSLKAEGKDHREIRYGLLPELRRARELPGNAPFLTAVAEFLSLFNAENARRSELAHRRMWRVPAERFAAFTRLVDEHGANVVGALLCAYGTCTDRRPPSAGPESDLDVEPAASEGPDDEQPESE